jgi:hypothetical protein
MDTSSLIHQFQKVMKSSFKCLVWLRQDLFDGSSIPFWSLICWVNRYAVSTCSAICYAKPRHTNKSQPHALEFLLLCLVLSDATQFVIKIAVHRSRSIPATNEFSSTYNPAHKPWHRSCKPRCLLSFLVCHPAGFWGLSVCMCSVALFPPVWNKISLLLPQNHGTLVAPENVKNNNVNFACFKLNSFIHLTFLICYVKRIDY